MHDIDIEDIEYQRHDGTPLLARLHVPRGPGPFALLAEVHGGAWCRGTRLDEDGLNQALARRGIVVAALDFRQPPQSGYPASLADINHALRWLKANAGRWRSQPQRVGVMGLSSGAHQALLAAMRPRDPRYAALPLPGHAEVDATPAFAVLCWPVIDPLGRYRYAKALRAGGQPYPEAIDRVIPDHERYWPDEAAMAEGSPLQALERGEPAHLPPLLYLQGEADLMHPREQLDRFVAAYAQAGGSVELKLYPGEDTGFISRRPDAPASADALQQIAAFVQRHGGGASR
ncbi:MAG: alpha/beta hydrolase [Proteobacteria bacterium]|nr:alpha/beta hydrolase [Pseudomonadota bacterium]